MLFSELHALANKCASNYQVADTDGAAPIDEMSYRIVLRDDAVRKKLIAQGNTSHKTRPFMYAGAVRLTQR